MCIRDRSISDTSVNDKSVLTESTVCDDDKVNDDDDIKSPNETTCLASSNEIAQQQRHDKSLAAFFKLAERGRGGFAVKDNLLIIVQNTWSIIFAISSPYLTT